MSISPLPERWVCTSRSRDCIRPCTASSRRTSRATIRSGSRTSTAIGHHSRSTSSPSFCCRFSSATRRRCSSSSIASDSTSGARWSLCWLPISTSRRRTTTRYCRRRRRTRVTRCSVDCFRARSRRQITRQWFQRSALFSVLKEASRRKISVLLTTDHGSIHCNTPATVYAKRDASANLRYKFGEDLRAERPDQALLFSNEDMLRLPRRGAGGNTLLATNDCFFVYPTKLREYQSRYRGSFLHGGVTPEEVILPLALLTPRR